MDSTETPSYREAIVRTIEAISKKSIESGAVKTRETTNGNIHITIEVLKKDNLNTDEINVRKRLNAAGVGCKTDYSPQNNLFPNPNDSAEPFGHIIIDVPDTHAELVRLRTGLEKSCITEVKEVVSRTCKCFGPDDNKETRLNMIKRILEEAEKELTKEQKGYSPRR